MDPLSITAATIGITSFALSSIKQLRDNIDDVAEAKEVLEDISTDLTGILAPLDSLRVLLHASRTDHAVLRSEQSSNADRQSARQQMQVLETEIEAHRDWAQQLSDELIERRNQLQLAVRDPEHEAQGDLEDAIQEVGEQARILEANLFSSTVMRAKFLPS